MARCEGTTKNGSRCRRQAAVDSAYCGMHAEQAEADVGATADEKAPDREPRSKKAARPSRDRHPLAVATVAGIVAITLLALRRVIRF